MTTPYKKKLIEVAIPLEAMNRGSAYEKLPGIGPHPRGIHQWWARRPHVTCRAILFAQLVDDPSSSPEIFKTTEEVDAERKRLFLIIERLSDWKNNNDKELFDTASAEIKKFYPNGVPPVHDPFSGGASISYEAQRLGLSADSSDLNPVPVLIGKITAQYAFRFKDCLGITGSKRLDSQAKGVYSLADDLRHYSDLLLGKFKEKLSYLYAPTHYPSSLGGGEAQVVAWLWAKTVASPDPSLGGLHIPLLQTFNISTTKGRSTWLEPIIDNGNYRFAVRSEISGDVRGETKGTVNRQGATCIVSGAAVPLNYIREQAKAGLLGKRLVAVAVDGKRGKVYLEADGRTPAEPSEVPKNVPSATIEHWPGSTNCVVYGITEFSQLYSSRQKVALITAADEIRALLPIVEKDAVEAGIAVDARSLENGGSGAKAYSEMIVSLLSFALSRCADFNNMHCGWNPSNEKVMHLFGRTAIPMTWDYAEPNFLRDVVGGWPSVIDYQAKCIETLRPLAPANIEQKDAAEIEYVRPVIISTDPPYYDNVPYSNLADFFYVWLRYTLKEVFPSLFSTLQTPKKAELVANQFRIGGKQKAEEFFLEGMKKVMGHLAKICDPETPATIYYAFKQSEIEQEGIASTGWAAFLESVLAGGFEIVATWPVRTESTTRLRAFGSNALATSVVMVCRPRRVDSKSETRVGFIRALKKELPTAIAEMQAANIAPADMPQSAIGPGMGVFSRYKVILESDDSSMSVKTALQLINRELDDYLGGIQGEFDPETRFAITWYEQNGNKAGDYGTANNIATARGISVESVKHAGIVESSAGKVRILTRDELDPDWQPEDDTHLTVWECCQHLVRLHEKNGIGLATAVMMRKIGAKADDVRDLVYVLYNICEKRGDAKEATSYNALIADWTDLTREAASAPLTTKSGQMRFEV